MDIKAMNRNGLSIRRIAKITGLHRKTVKRHPDELILMFLDQAAWHKARALPIPVNIKLLNLPPHSPELNPTEHVWEDIREKWFANLVFKSITAVEDTLVKALVTLERDADRVAGITGFDWIISANKVTT